MSELLANNNINPVRETCAGLTTAGRLTHRPFESTADCMNPEDPPPTPEHMRKYRLSGRGSPGVTVRHPGRADDPPFQAESEAYGDRIHYTYGVNVMLNPQPISNFAQAAIEHKESIYHSHKNAPLGRSLSRNYSYPDRVYEPGFSFGHPPEPCPPAKDIMYPLEHQEDPAAKELYKKTHRDFDSGEQRTRGYDWSTTRVDPKSFAFGYKLPYEEEPVKKSLIWNGGDAATGKPQQIVNSVVDRREQHVHYSLGKVRKSLAAKDQHDPNRVFGLESTGRNYTAGEAISGLYTKEEQQPDPDLGTYRRGISPNTKVLNVSRTFGTPSIRSDLKLPPIKSVTNPLNYGDELAAKNVVNPNRFSEMGVSEREMLMPLGYEELKDIIMSSGVSVNGEQFDRAFSLASKETGSSEVSLDSFRKHLPSVY